MTTKVTRSPLALAILGLLSNEPLHPYAIQQRIREWGKDRVINVGQRASLYKTIARLLAGNLVAVRETERDQQYPERTVYEITPEGRAASHAWMAEMIDTPRNEYPDLPAALSFLALLTPKKTQALLAQRREKLKEAIADADQQLANANKIHLPRVLVLEEELIRKMLSAELAWVDAIIAELRTGKLTWSDKSLRAFAASH